MTSTRLADPSSAPTPALALGPIALALLLAAPAPAPGDDAPAAMALFDGKSLDGWEKTDFYKPGEVSVADGSIILAASPVSGGMTGITTTRDDLPRTNYELSYRAKRLTGRDFFAAATFPVGDSFLTLVNGGWGGSITGLSSIDGADASENQTGSYHEYANDTWYSFRVRVTDASIRCWVDDEELVDFDPRDHHLDTRLETSANQPLGFCTWETGGALRDIAIRPLTPAEVAESAPDDDAP